MIYVSPYYLPPYSPDPHPTPSHLVISKMKFYGVFRPFLQRSLPFSTVKHRQKIIRSKMSLADNCFIFQNEILPSPLNCINPYPSLDRVLWKFEGLECSFCRFSKVATNHTTIGHVSEKLRRNKILYEYNWHYLKNHHFFNKIFQSSFWVSVFIINDFLRNPHFRSFSTYYVHTFLGGAKFDQIANMEQSLSTTGYLMAKWTK